MRHKKISTLKDTKYFEDKQARVTKSSYKRKSEKNKPKISSTIKERSLRRNSLFPITLSYEILFDQLKKKGLLRKLRSFNPAKEYLPNKSISYKFHEGFRQDQNYANLREQVECDTYKGNINNYLGRRESFTKLAIIRYNSINIKFS